MEDDSVVGGGAGSEEVPWSEELHLELFRWGPKATELNDNRVVPALKPKTSLRLFK